MWPDVPAVPTHVAWCPGCADTCGLMSRLCWQLTYSQVCAKLFWALAKVTYFMYKPVHFKRQNGTSVKCASLATVCLAWDGASSGRLKFSTSSIRLSLIWRFFLNYYFPGFYYFHSLRSGVLQQKVNCLVITKIANWRPVSDKTRMELDVESVYNTPVLVQTVSEKEKSCMARYTR